jgi:hypothetical protein
VNSCAPAKIRSTSPSSAARRAGVLAQQPVEREQRRAGLEQVAALGELVWQHLPQLLQARPAHQLGRQLGRAGQALADQQRADPQAEQPEPVQQHAPHGRVSPGATTATGPRRR